MSQSLDRAAKVREAARQHAWLEVGLLLDCALEGLREIGAIGNGDAKTAGAMRVGIEVERAKIEEHLGTRRDPEPVTIKLDTELVSGVKEARRRYPHDGRANHEGRASDVA